MDYSRNFQRENSVVYSSSFSVLDGIPFKIGPQFKPPNQIILPPELNLTRISSSANLKYEFEVEKGVLEWAEERERQLQVQRRAEEERIANSLKQAEDSSSDDSEEDAWLESQQNHHTTVTSSASESSTTNSVPQPVIAGLSNTLLTPIQINPSNGNNIEQRADNSVDVSLFEKEEDPFDRFERATLNDLEELKSVFATTETTQAANTNSDDIYENTNSTMKEKSESAHVPNGIVRNVNSSDEIDSQNDYENVEIIQKQFKQKEEVKSDDTAKQIDLSKLPPVPARKQFLTGRNPLPPIGDVPTSNPFADDVFDPFQSNVQTDTQPVYQNTTPVYENVDIHQNGGCVSYTKTENDTNVAQPSVKQRPKVPPRPEFVHIKPKAKPRHNYVNIAPNPPSEVGGTATTMKSSNSSPDISNTANNLMDYDNARYTPPFVLSKTPPDRPSSQQSWNRYSPLPPTSATFSPVSQSSSNSDMASPSEVDPYTSLSNEAQKFVDGLIDMGFSRPRAARAMQKLGQDKEVIEHLCLVNQMSEEGYDPYQSEQALLLFENNSQKAHTFLDLSKQFQELGFSQDRIKEALISNDMDRDKALDYLTT